MATLINQPETRKPPFVTANLRWYFSFFLVSGFCALVYEVIWLRLAMAAFGVTTALASIVIALFMAGLGLGSWGAGDLVCRLSRRGRLNSLRWYSSAEFLVGVSSIAVPVQLKLGRLLMLRFARFASWQSSTYYVVAGLWLTVTILPWCICMGSTFPLLMAAIRERAGAVSQHSFSYLYVANVIGALAGTIVSAFILIELLGFRKTLLVAGALNMTLAVLASILSLRANGAIAIRERVRSTTPDNLYGYSRAAILVLLFTTGLVSMGMEIIWIRQFTPYLGNVVYAFAAILIVYLSATAVGSLDYRRWVYSHEVNESRSAWSVLALCAVFPTVATSPLLRTSIGPVGFGIVRVAAIAPFCALAGFLTPLIIDSWSHGDPARAGTAYAANIMGCIIGPLLTGFLLLPVLGERVASIVLVVPVFVIAAAALFQKPVPGTEKARLAVKFGLAAIAAIALFWWSRDYETMYPAREVQRDYAATVVATGTGFDRLLLVNGIGMTALSPVTKYMAHLPLAFATKPPQSGLVICFGMGTTFRSMLSWGIQTTAVELVPSVPKVFGYYHSDAPELLRSPLARVVIDDGRRFLDGSNQMYDVIVVDPPPPPAAPGSSLLYSSDFYDIVKRHLSSDGILQVWHPEAFDGSDAATTAAITKALTQSFPYVRAFRAFDGSAGIHYLASMRSIEVLSPTQLAARLPLKAAADFIEWGPKPNVQEQFEILLSHELSPEKLIAADPRVPPIQDDQPINEYYLLRRWVHSYR